MADLPSVAGVLEVLDVAPNGVMPVGVSAVVVVSETFSRVCVGSNVNVG